MTDLPEDSGRPRAVAEVHADLLSDEPRASPRMLDAQITPTELAAWFADWQHDLKSWSVRLRRLPRYPNLAEALVRLDLDGGSTVSADFDRPPRRQDERSGAFTYVA